jgi:protein-S-isoprenylcysteine O-methyltransferase Ste14
MLIAVVLAPLLPLITLGLGPECLIFAAISILGFIISRVLAARRHPDLLAERARFMSARDTKAWDKILAPALAFSTVVILAVAGLDRLYGWTPAFPLWTKLIALVVIVLGFMLGSGRYENRFRHGAHPDRTAISLFRAGLYRLIRHPGMRGL